MKGYEHEGTRVEFQSIANKEPSILYQRDQRRRGTSNIWKKSEPDGKVLLRAKNLLTSQTSKEFLQPPSHIPRSPYTPSQFVCIRSHALLVLSVLCSLVLVIKLLSFTTFYILFCDSAVWTLQTTFLLCQLSPVRFCHCGETVWRRKMGNAHFFLFAVLSAIILHDPQGAAATSSGHWL